MSERTRRRPYLRILVTIAIWLVLWGILLFGVYSYGKDNYVLCWDSVAVDEDMLLSLCGMTESEYLAGGDMSDCPEGYDAIHMIGGCEPDWDSIRALLITSSLIYNPVFWVLTGGILLVRRIAHKGHADSR